MSYSLLPSVETIKRWMDYWRKFKGKRVRVFLKSGFTTKASSQIVDSDNSTMSSALEELCYDTLTGTISDIVESPFGIWLTDVIVPEGNDFDGVFIPMPEILRMYSYKKSSTGFQPHDVK
jgi:hypothetical protein